MLMMWRQSLESKCNIALFGVILASFAVVSTFSTKCYGDEKTLDTSRRILVVLGTPGESQYAEQFRAWGEKWKVNAQKANVSFVLIDGTNESSEQQPSDLETLKQSIATAQSEAVQELWLVMLGHGTFYQGEAKFNLRGPDLSATELAKTLEQFSGRVAIMNGSSSSAPFINALAKNGRVVITATKSGNEQNYARFGGYFSEAISNPIADLDHDDSVSLLEAFLFASGEARKFYASEARLVTETALLDDNGDGKGISSQFFRGIRSTKETAKGEAIDGSEAARWVLVPAEGEKSLSQEQENLRRNLEDQLRQLKLEKEVTPADEYYAKLEEILVKLALLSEQAASK